MRTFTLICSIALTLATVTFFYQMKLITTDPIYIRLVDVLMIGVGAALSVAFFIKALRIAPRVYRLAITGMGILFWIFSVFLWGSNLFLTSVEVKYFSTLDLITVIATGIVMGYGVWITVKQDKERTLDPVN